MGSLMFDAGKAAAEAPARFAERQAIIAYIRKRSQSVANLAKSGRLTEADAHRLKRWLGALADDIDAQLHDESDE